MGTSGSPLLRIGVTSAIFHARANVLVKKELFTMRVIVESVEGRLSFKILGEILSIPGALLDGNFLITLSTWLSVTSQSLNISTLLVEVGRGTGGSKVRLSP